MGKKILKNQATPPTLPDVSQINLNFCELLAAQIFSKTLELYEKKCKEFAINIVQSFQRGTCFTT